MEPAPLHRFHRWIISHHSILRVEQTLFAAELNGRDQHLTNERVLAPLELLLEEEAHPKGHSLAYV